MLLDLRKISTGPVILLLVACGAADPEPADEDDSRARVVEVHRQEVEAWRQGRISRLTAEDGWLTVVGLDWLKPGPNPAGGVPVSAVFLRGAGVPERVGVLHWDEDGVIFEPAPGARVRHGGEPLREPLALRSDAEGGPTILEVGTLRFHLIRRADRMGVRVRDPESRARREFEGIDSFPVDLDWRVDARFEPYDPPEPLRVPDFVGIVHEELSPGAVVFERQGRTHRLHALDAGWTEDGDRRLFLILADATTGSETYGGGRYLYVDAPADGGPMVVDFNMAYNPPCVFTPFATCPLPPRGNRLDLEIRAGERIYTGPVAGL